VQEERGLREPALGVAEQTQLPIRRRVLRGGPEHEQILNLGFVVLFLLEITIPARKVAAEPGLLGTTGARGHRQGEDEWHEQAPGRSATARRGSISGIRSLS
jgi:hypothetical protein